MTGRRHRQWLLQQWSLQALSCLNRKQIIRGDYLHSSLCPGGRGGDPGFLQGASFNSVEITENEVEETLSQVEGTGALSELSDRLHTECHWSRVPDSGAAGRQVTVPPPFFKCTSRVSDTHYSTARIQQVGSSSILHNQETAPGLTLVPRISQARGSGPGLHHPDSKAIPIFTAPPTLPRYKTECSFVSLYSAVEPVVRTRAFGKAN